MRIRNLYNFINLKQKRLTDDFNKKLEMLFQIQQGNREEEDVPDEIEIDDEDLGDPTAINESYNQILPKIKQYSLNLDLSNYIDNLNK